MLIFDYLGTKVLDSINQKFEEYIKQDELQKILLQCFEDTKTRENNLEGFVINKEKIMSINPIKIQPNLTLPIIENNLKFLFKDILNIDNIDKFNSLKKEVCSSYLIKAQKDTLCLFHIQEGLDNITDGIDEIKTTNQKQDEKLESIRTKISNQTGVRLHFVDELDESKAFFYLTLEISYYIEDNGEEEENNIYFFNDMIEQCDVNAETDFYIQNQMQYVNINFYEPILQCDLKNFLRDLNIIFKKENIQIYSITTHL